MSGLAVEATLRGFRQQQLSDARTLLSAVVFAVACTDNAKPTGAAGLVEFVATPLVGALSDRFRRKFLLIACLLGLGSARTATWALKVLGFSPVLFEALAAGCVGGLAAVSKSVLIDYSWEPLEVIKSSVFVSSIGAAGALSAPFIRGVTQKLIGSEKFPDFLSAAVAFGCAGAVLVAADDSSAEIPEDVEYSLMGLSPFSFTRLTGRNNRDATLAMAASFCTDFAGGIAIREIIEQNAKVSSPSAVPRLRYLLASALTCILGNKIATVAQGVVGLDDQASLASIAHVGMALGLVIKQPILSAVCMLFAQRASDATDTFLIENRKDGGKGETVASITNWHTLASVIAALGLGFVQKKGGTNSVAAAVVLSSVLGEYLRRKIQVRKMSPM